MADRQLRSVQLLRGLAALGVVLTHLVGVERKYLPGPPLTPAGLQLGGAGVDLFFVISGFIMSSLTLGRPRQPGDSRRFLLRRSIRIYPLYWVYFALVLPLLLLDPGMVNSAHGRPDLLTSFFLLPDRRLPLLMVAWTLSFELYFYLAFATLRRVCDDRHMPAALCAWGMLVAAGSLALRPTPQQPALHLLCNPLDLEFIAGCMVARLRPRIGRTAATACLVAAAALAGAGAARFGTAPILDVTQPWTRVLIYGAAAALLLAGALGWEAACRRVPGVVTDIGDASYSLYLSHILVLGAVGWVWHRWLAGPGALNHGAVIALGLAAALLWCRASFRFIEQPLLGCGHRLQRMAEHAADDGLGWRRALAVEGGPGGVNRRLLEPFL